MFGVREWVIATVAAFGALLALGLPSDIIQNPFFIRMIPVRTQDYVIWIASATLLGLLAGTFALRPADGNRGKLFGGGLMSFFAVGCPICNKVVLLALGTSGALTYFAPIQLYLGVAAVVLLLLTLRWRARAIIGPCPL
ncbi:MAG: hypothetical protein IIB12_05845 [Chloroflexi bacterium]|nr:hypothetical protein [Chloroflexota bacterium]MCH8195580.1 hypothetical protein [Chloroflexota bacterium]MCH8283541.1 hypothetical protein [Chloroflexota bacterium]